MGRFRYGRSQPAVEANVRGVVSGRHGYAFFFFRDAVLIVTTRRAHSAGLDPQQGYTLTLKHTQNSTLNSLYLVCLRRHASGTREGIRKKFECVDIPHWAELTLKSLRVAVP